MLPFSNETVTLYHKRKYTDDYGKNQTAWDRYVIQGCSWGCTGTKISIGDISIGSTDTAVKLPSDSYVEPWEVCGNNQFTVQTGDIIIKGIADDEITDTAILIKKYSGRAITVKTVRNNSGAGKRLGHIAVTGA